MKNKPHILVIVGTGSIGFDICKKFVSEEYDLTFTSSSLKKIIKK